MPGGSLSATIARMIDGSAGETKPVFIYDGECSFCRRWIARWEMATAGRVDYAPYQEVSESFPEVSNAAFAEAAHFVEADGSISCGAEAVFRLLAYAPCKRWPLLLYQNLPGTRTVCESAYRLVARHRRGLSVVTSLLWGSDVTPSGHLLSRWLFVRLIGLIYLIAFLSLAVQIVGLVGKDGILPATEYLEAVRDRFDSDAYWRFPTVAWFGASDTCLRALCWVGVASSVLVIFRAVPALFLLVNWVLYLSL